MPVALYDNYRADFKVDSEEITEDVRARMISIQENEIEQLRDLTSFLDTETRFIQQYLDVLKEAKSEWVDESVSHMVKPLIQFNLLNNV